MSLLNNFMHMVLVMLFYVFVFVQVESNYRTEVKVFKKFHANIIGKGGSTLKKVPYSSLGRSGLLFSK